MSVTAEPTIARVPHSPVQEPRMAEEPAEPTSPLTFPPIPLVSGETVAAEDGASHRVARVEILVTCEDGSERRIPLEPRFGGWWAPQP